MNFLKIAILYLAYVCDSAVKAVKNMFKKKENSGEQQDEV